MYYPRDIAQLPVTRLWYSRFAKTCTTLFAALLKEDLQDTGRFLVRQKEGSGLENVIISVVYKGQCTHHALTKADGEPYAVNGAKAKEDVDTLTKVRQLCASASVNIGV